MITAAAQHIDGPRVPLRVRLAGDFRAQPVVSYQVVH